MFRQSVFIAISLTAACLLAGNSIAQTKSYPSEQFTLIVPFGAGGGADLVARHIAKGITEKTMLPAIVENRAGANGIIGAQQAKNAQPNGYNILITTGTTQAANPSLYKALPYDPVKDFEPVGQIAIGGVVLVVAANSSVHNLADFLKLAKASKKPLTYGSGNSSSQAGAELLKTYAGLSLLNVPYKSIPAALTDLIGGQVDFVFADSIAVLPMIKSGKLRAIGVSTKTRIPGLDNVPTMAEQGLKDYEFVGWMAAYTPKGVGEEKRKYLNTMLNEILNGKLTTRFLNDNGWIVKSGSMEDLRDFQRKEIGKWKKIVDVAGMTVQ